MVQLTQLYKGIDSFKYLLDSNNFDKNQDCFVRFFTSDFSRKSINNVISEIKSVLPNCTLVGSTSSSAIIFQSKQYENESVVIVNTFDNIKVKTKLFSWVGLNAKDVLNNIKDDFGKNKDLVNIIFSNSNGCLYDIIDEFVHYTNLLNPFIKFVGGVAGDSYGNSFVFNNDGIEPNGVVLFSYSSDLSNLSSSDIVPNYFTHTSIAADQISDFHEVTKVSGKDILEIDNTPASRWFYDFLDVNRDENLSFDEFKDVANNSFFNGFTIISNKHNNNSRCLKYDAKLDTVSLFSSAMSVGSKFKVAYLNPHKIISQSYVLCGNILLENIESLFVYSCFARKSNLDFATKLELTPLAQNDVSGVFFLGEICNSGDKNNLYNASCCVVGFAENNKYAHVDTSLLRDISVKPDLHFYDKALRKKSQISNVKDTSDIKYFDSDFNVPNLLKYEYDLTKNLFDKIAVVEVLTADSTIAYASLDRYIQTQKDIFLRFDNLLDKYNSTENISLYILNYKTFIITGSNTMADEDFLNLMKKTYSKLGFYTSDITHHSSVTRFAVVLNQADMLKTGTALLYANKSSQENFIISENNTVAEENILAEEGFYLSLLKRAIDNDMVTPHYQGVRNNKTNKIEKYQSLMRIEENGITYHPDSFLQTAKKFKLYAKISEQLIKKVLHEFQDKDESIIINLSYQDIESKQFRNWLTQTIKSYRRPERILIEFTKTDDATDLGLIRDFVTTTRNSGANITITELNLGYSAFAQVIDSGKDFTSLDNDTLRSINTSEINSKVLDTIRYLADTMGIQTIAEFTDNLAIKSLSDENNSDTSQLFSFF